jgi:hypothetical protein
VLSALRGLAGRLRACGPALPALLAASALLAGRDWSPDLSVYERYAREAVASGLHSLPVEYPFSALAVFLPPLFVPLPYAAAFGLLAAAAVVALVTLSDGLPEHPGWASRTCVYLLAGTAAVVLSRYDVFPAICALLAVEGARRKDRWGRAWAWAVAGGLLKLFPWLLLPGFLLAERRQEGRWPLRRLYWLLPIAAVAVSQQAFAPGSIWSPVGYELRRGFELSSVPGSLTFLLGLSRVRWAAGFGSVEVLGPGGPAISAVLAVAAALALLYTWRLLAKGALRVEAASLAVLSVAVLSDKAFAPQYLIWLVPLWAYWPLRRGWVAAAALTALVFPVLYAEPGVLGPGYYAATAAAALRNSVLLVATLRWLSEQAHAQVPAVSEQSQLWPLGEAGPNGGAGLKEASPFCVAAPQLAVASREGPSGAPGAQTQKVT